ncbi:MAG: hypothetical protein CTY37_03360 [Methylotenera sp.]|nr:MAG: hypothetical protein CTY37_03360 [Methylotenera sp.]PPD18203.1 MAG: hypothetical protein CTY27_02220 [Methylotenera sp.]
MFTALFLLFIKHFICDFPLQAYPWMYRNKGTYLHPGGIVHALIHGIGTTIVLLPFISLVALMYGIVDWLVHYHIDWAKMGVSKRYDLQPNNSEKFWILLGFDQLLHHITYFALVYFAFNLTL